ncbi:MAG: hypothetical protein H0V49_12350 [Nocardioidaceae bacterium]|nr:hypothetical protein [Nocardioidaceae bacterium]
MSRRRRGVVAAALLACAIPSSSSAVGVVECYGRPANVVGTEGADRLVGSLGDDVIVALGGDDVVHGRGGNDWICGGPDRDTLSGGPGDDHVYGQEGGDALIEGFGDDVAAAGPDGLYGDLLTYASSRRAVTISLETHSTVMGPNRDTVRGFDSYYGTAYDDVLTGTDRRDSLYGGPGNDDIAGYGAQDYLRGDEGDDTIVGGEGPDDLEGGGGFDRLTDLQGDNVVSDLTLTGATGAAVLTGSGNDTVEVESDEQAAEITVSSGAGADRVYLSGLISTGRVLTGAGEDFIGMQLDAAGDLVVRGQRDDDVLGLAGAAPGARQPTEVMAVGGQGTDNLVFSNIFGNVTLSLGAEGRLTAPVAMELPGFEAAQTGYGDDVITGSPERNLILSADGDDKIYGLGGDDVLDAGYGVDVVRGGIGLDRCIDAETQFGCE